MSPIILGFLLIWLFSAATAHIQFVYYLQLKEYRVDRLLSFLKTASGKQLLMHYEYMWRVIGGLALYLTTHRVLSLQIILTIIFAVDIAAALYRQRSCDLRRPAMTGKAVLLLLLSILFEGFLLVFTLQNPVLLLVLLTRPALTLVAVMLVHIPSSLVKRRKIEQAKRKMQTYSHLIVIGITGSYGKTSVKEFVAHILGQSYRVVKTPRNTNTDIGIAAFILSTDFSGIDVFVCEMGAYRKGEISAICDMVEPLVGILTAINEQHIDLFGSIQNTHDAKYELLKAIPERGYAITNADSEVCVDGFDSLVVKKKQTFGLDADQNPDVIITDVREALDGVAFTWTFEGNTCVTKTPVLGAHHASNIAAAVMVASHFGMSPTDITEACKTLPTKTHGSLQLFDYGKATILDDSYNSNPAGFRSALNVLSLFPSSRKRVVITRGMIELGVQAGRLHQEVGEEIAFVADELIVTRTDAYESLKKGVGAKYKTQVRLISDPEKQLSYVKDLFHQDAVILIENRLPSRVMDELTERRKKR
jgi:UDP-N-acetylmuramoyl-tripeptide--D-alanyl-D-alanine ligase